MGGQRPILVTGSIRSGTTWVGKTLGTAPNVAVIHEPFNMDHPMGLFAHRWTSQYTYLDERAEEEASVERALGDTLSFRYRPGAHLRNRESLGRTLGIVRDLPRFWYRRLVSSPRPIVKDPIALFSAEWLAERFDMEVVVMIRHPGAFAWSFKRIAEPNRLADLLAQGELMEGLLAPFVADLERAARIGDPMHQAATLWRISYATVSGYGDRHPDWVFLRHEDLSLSPLGGFHVLFDRLDMPFTRRTARFIDLTTNASNPTEAPPAKLHHLRRNSADNVAVWQQRLSPDEIGCVRHLTEDVAAGFYEASSWP